MREWTATADAVEAAGRDAAAAGRRVSALAYLRRAAAVADPGVVDVSASWLEPLPKSLRKELADGKQEQFDRTMRIGERFDRSATALLTFRGEPYLSTRARS